MTAEKTNEKPDAAAAKAMLRALANLGEDELAFFERRLCKARLSREEARRREYDY